MSGIPGAVIAYSPLENVSVLKNWNMKIVNCAVVTIYFARLPLILRRRSSTASGAQPV